MTTTSHTIQGLSEAATQLLGEPEMLIDGAWVTGESANTLSAVNPSTGVELGTFASAAVDQTRRAVGAARRAFDSGPWRDTSPQERSGLLRDLAALMEENRTLLEEIVVTEVGCPIMLTRMMQVGMPIANIEWSAAKALTGPPGGYEEALTPHLSPPSSSLLIREPVGVISAITGYNFPINSVVWKVGPGLAAGCTLVVKPSERTPLSTLAFMRLVDRVGFPCGVVNFLLGGGDVGHALSADPDVDMVMFTGSLNIGKKIMIAAAETTKRVVLELGGKSANIVLPGADVEQVAGPSILRWMRNSGQGCGATTRTLVPRSMYDDFAEQTRTFLDKIVVGDPRLESTDLGPVIREEQRQFVEGFVNRALDAGATVEAGGGRPDLPGFYVNPTVIGNVTNRSEICREELFGPVGTLLAYDDLRDAVAIAEDNQYGLHAAIWGDFAEALRIARRLRTGAVSINGGGFMRPEGPWGGYKASGFGREMGDDGYREFFEVKHVQWPIR